MATRLAAANRIADNGRMPVAYPPDADGYLPLKTSVVGRGMLGAISYTRATTATVTDHEGVIRNCIAGEARFQGARRVRNYYKYSQDITNATWTKASLTATANTAIAPDGTLTADSLTSIVGTNIFTEIAQAALTTVIGNTYLYSLYVKDNGQRYLQLIGTGAHFGTGYVNFDLQSGTITATSGAMTGSIANVGNGWYRIMVSCVAIGAAPNGRLTLDFIDTATSIRGSAYTGDGVKAIYIWGHQFEDVTGQSVQTAAEYVSTNVLNAAPYHGSNVDGVKYFDTDLNGTPIPKSTLKGFLCEGARTNLFLQSEDFSTAWSVVGGGIVTSNNGVSPDGKQTMDLYVPGSTTILQTVNQSVTTTSGIYTYSIYVKSSGYNFVQLWASASISSGYVNFDISTGVVTASSLWTGSIESVGNGIYRLIAVTNTLLATTNVIVLSPIPSGTSVRASSFAGDGTKGFLLWGAQFELGPNVSSYIPTTTTTATRNIDVLTYDVRNVIANQGALSVVCSMNGNEIFDRRVLNLSSFTVNRLHVQARTGGVPNISIVYGDGVNVRSVTGVAAGTNNIATSWTNGVGLNLYMNNIKYIGNFVPSLAFTTIDVGGGSLGYPLFGCIRDLRIWKTRPTDDELLLLSNNP